MRCYGPNNIVVVSTRAVSPKVTSSHLIILMADDFWPFLTDLASSSRKIESAHEIGASLIVAEHLQSPFIPIGTKVLTVSWNQGK